MNDDPNIEPVDLSPTRNELIARVRARGRQIRARRRLATSGLAAVVVVAIAVPAIALGSRSNPHSVPPAATTTTTAVAHSDFRVAIITRVSPEPGHFGGPCDATDGKLCYVLGATVMTARDVRGDRVVEDAPGQGWDVQVTVAAAAIRRLAAHVNEQAAIVIGGSVISAPTVQPGITGTTIEISNHFTHAQATRIAAEILGRTPPAENVTARIDLPGDHTYVAGTAVQGALVVDNETGKWWQRPDANGCPIPWVVELTKPGSAIYTPTFEGCTSILKEWRGIVRFPFAMRTITHSCADAPVAASCDPGPPLPPGRYTAVLVAAAPGWPKPHGVTVTLVAAQPSR